MRSSNGDAIVYSLQAISKTSTLQTGKPCYYTVNVLVLMCRIARELNLSPLMVRQREVFGLFLSVKATFSSAC